MTLIGQSTPAIIGPVAFPALFLRTAQMRPEVSTFGFITPYILVQGFMRKTALMILIKAADVPVPAAVWLFGSGLIVLIGIRKKSSA